MFGPHVHRVMAARGGRPTIAEQIEAARLHAVECGVRLGAVQVFVAGPRNRRLTLTLEEAKELATRGPGPGESKAAPPLHVTAHGTYLDLPWKGSPKAAPFIRKELILCAAAGITGLVLHLGRVNHEAVVSQLAGLYVEKATTAAGQPVRIYLETPALKGGSPYDSPDKLRAFFELIRAKCDPDLTRTGLCIDTAHLWACGVDLSSRAAAQAWLDGLTRAAAIIPPGALMFHLNDNVHERASGRDKHNVFGEGAIWPDYTGRFHESGLAAFVEYAVAHSIPTILERNAPSKIDGKALTAKRKRETIMEQLADDYATLHALTPSLRVGGGADIVDVGVGVDAGLNDFGDLDSLSDISELGDLDGLSDISELGELDDLSGISDLGELDARGDLDDLDSSDVARPEK